LSTAYGLVKENKGNIRVGRTSAAGTTFVLEFELYQAPKKHRFGGRGITVVTIDFKRLHFK
jgi:hypothetical protein